MFWGKGWGLGNSRKPGEVLNDDLDSRKMLATYYRTIALSKWKRGYGFIRIFRFSSYRSVLIRFIRLIRGPLSSKLNTIAL